MSFFNIFARRDINAGVKTYRETKGAVLLDVRTRAEYAEGHIEGSINIPLDELQRIESVVSDKQIPLFVHCLSGARSARAVAFLRKIGYSDVQDIGGIGSYNGEII